VQNWDESYKALKTLLNNPEYRTQVGDAIFEDYENRLEMLNRAYSDGGWDGSVTAGVEAGRLGVDILGLLTGVGGVAKLSTQAAATGSKAIIKLADNIGSGPSPGSFGSQIGAVGDVSKVPNPVGANGGVATTVITPAMETKILYGERVVNASGTPTNRLIGAHGGEIANSNPNYAVEVLSVNVDGTRNAKLLTQFSDGSVSNIKTSTLFPENWTPSQSIGAVKQVGDSVPVATRADGAALYQSTVNGVQIEVIKVGNNVTAGYPVGSRGFQTKTYFLTGKN
jgi:hypothetical protein